jgi:hypothetical protein
MRAGEYKASRARATRLPRFPAQADENPTCPTAIPTTIPAPPRSPRN